MFLFDFVGVGIGIDFFYFLRSNGVLVETEMEKRPRYRQKTRDILPGLAMINKGDCPFDTTHEIEVWPLRQGFFGGKSISVIRLTTLYLNAFDYRKKSKSSGIAINA